MRRFKTTLAGERGRVSRLSMIFSEPQVSESKNRFPVFADADLRFGFML
jgi:hypothetical protein